MNTRHVLLQAANSCNGRLPAVGFLPNPMRKRFDMLCSAATDIYTGLWMERLLCLDRVPDFALAHLPNKYTSRMGLPAVEMEWQLDALRKIHADELPKMKWSPRDPISYGIWL